MLVILLSLCLVSCMAGNQPREEWWRGLNAIEEGRFDLARNDLESVVAERPDDLEACTQFARAWSSGTMQSPVRAIPIWERCRALQPSDEAAIEISRAHLRLGEYELTLEALEEVEPSASRSALEVEALLHLERERAWIEISDAVVRYPENASLRKLAGRAAHLREDYETALSHLSRAVELDPLDARMYYLLGTTRQRLGDEGGAALAFEHHEWVSRLSGSGGWDEPTTLEKLRLLDALAFRTPAVEVLAIENLGAAGRGAEAIEAAERLLLDADARSWDLLRAEAVVARSRQSQLALRLLEGALREGTDPRVEREVHYRRARLHLRNDDLDAALEEIASVLSEEPWLARFLDLRAHVELAAGDTRNAAASFENALELAPWRADSRVALAEIELGEGERERARRLLLDAPESSALLSDFRERHAIE